MKIERFKMHYWLNQMSIITSKVKIIFLCLPSVTLKIAFCHIEDEQLDLHLVYQHYISYNLKDEVKVIWTFVNHILSCSTNMSSSLWKRVDFFSFLIFICCLHLYSQTVTCMVIIPLVFTYLRGALMCKRLAYCTYYPNYKRVHFYHTDIFC